MTVKHISASKYQIKIYTDAVGGSLCAKAFLPLINASSPDRFKDAKLIAESSATDGCVVFDRYSGGFDLAL